MLACAAGSLASHLELKKFLSWTGGEQAASLAHILTAGASQLESARPGLAIARIAEMLRGDPDQAKALAAGRIHSWQQLVPGPAREALREFFDEFGDRALREAELSAPRWREDPSQVMSMLSAAVHNPSADADAALHRARESASNALQMASQGLRPIEIAVLRRLVAHAQRMAELRERMRASVTRALGEIRWVALEIDQRLAQLNPGFETGDVFFCTVEEILGALDQGRSDLRPLVRMRRAQMLRDQSRPETAVTFVGYPPCVQLPPSGGTVLRGLAAGAGVAEGKVRVLQAGRELADRIEPGEILVARTTDVGLTPLFLLAAGVVTELGGPLSHAALVAREYGVPTVVNVTGATLVLRTGELVRVDGNRGIVERLESRKG